jgi:hypothetical protein
MSFGQVKNITRNKNNESSEINFKEKVNIVKNNIYIIVFK